MIQTLISVEEYLSTSYRPDVDFVDGHIEERHVGERIHSDTIFRLVTLLRALGLFAHQEVRTQVQPERFRVPDVCAFLVKQTENRFTTPPFLCIEVLSPEDRIGRTLRVVSDYFTMGVPNVWILDPQAREAFVCTRGGTFQQVTEEISTVDLRFKLSLDSIFEV